MAIHFKRILTFLFLPLIFGYPAGLVFSATLMTRGRQRRHWRNWVMSMVWRWRSRWGPPIMGSVVSDLVLLERTSRYVYSSQHLPVRVFQGSQRDGGKRDPLSSMKRTLWKIQVYLCIYWYIYIFTCNSVRSRRPFSREILPIRRFCGNWRWTWNFNLSHLPQKHGLGSSKIPKLSFRWYKMEIEEQVSCSFQSKLRGGLFQDLSVFATNNAYAYK